MDVSFYADDVFQTLAKEMSHHVTLLETFHNVDDVGNILVPLQKFDEIKRRYVTYLLNAYDNQMSSGRH